MTSETSAATSSMNSPETWPHKVANYLEKKGRLELGTGMLALGSLMRSAEEQHRNREAESAHARRVAWGDSRPMADDDMRMTLGDETNTHHHHYPPPKSGGFLKALLGAGLLATGAGIPAGAWLVADAIRNQPAPVQQPSPDLIDTDTQYELRLGKSD